jgi:ABC-type branched-subunit amino acid transport system permease subunit
MVGLLAIALILGTNIIGPILIGFGFIFMILLHLSERRISISNPLQYSEGSSTSDDVLSRFILPFVIVIAVSLGLVLSFSANIGDMLLIWIEDSPSFYYTIPVQFYLVLTCLIVIYIAIRRLIASPFGRMITAVAQNEERAQALGFNSYHAKIVVLVISGAIASLSGALYASFIPVITPDTVLGVEVTINAMLYTIIGGLATLLGPLLGTGVVVYSERNLVELIEGFGLPGRLWLIVLGVMYIGIVLFMPLGIVGSLGRRVDSFKGKMRQMKVGRFEFGFKDSDYWAFGLMGAMGIVFLMTEDARLLLISIGIFGVLGALGLLLMFIFRREISTSMKAFGKRMKFRIIDFLERIISRLRGGK